MKKVKVAVICMNTGTNKPQNIEKALKFIDQAASSGANWVVLPEMFPFLGAYDKLYELSELESGPLIEQLCVLAKSLNITIFSGTVPERPASKSSTDNLENKTNNNEVRKVFNTLYAISSTGQIIAKYRKTHLFTLSAFKGSKKDFNESDGYLPGEEAITSSHEGWHIGYAICYDLRFPSYFQKLAQSGRPDAFVIPAAFTKATGSLHWETLLRARAIELQSYILASNQVGKHQNNHETYGHSMIISPLGEVLANTGAREGIAIAEIDLEQVCSFRKSIPIQSHMRTDLY